MDLMGVENIQVDVGEDNKLKNVENLIRKYETELYSQI